MRARSGRSVVRSAVWCWSMRSFRSVLEPELARALGLAGRARRGRIRRAGFGCGRRRRRWRWRRAAQGPRERGGSRRRRRVGRRRAGRQRGLRRTGLGLRADGGLSARPRLGARAPLRRAIGPGSVAPFATAARRVVARGCVRPRWGVGVGARAPARESHIGRQPARLGGLEQPGHDRDEQAGAADRDRRAADVAPANPGAIHPRPTSPPPRAPPPPARAPPL